VVETGAGRDLLSRNVGNQLRRPAECVCAVPRLYSVAMVQELVPQEARAGEWHQFSCRFLSLITLPRFSSSALMYSLKSLCPRGMANIAPDDAPMLRCRKCRMEFSEGTGLEAIKFCWRVDHDLAPQIVVGHPFTECIDKIPIIRID
jgi:hypothetical protein